MKWENCAWQNCISLTHLDRECEKCCSQWSRWATEWSAERNTKLSYFWPRNVCVCVAAKLVLAFAEHSAMVSLFLVSRVHRVKCLYAWRSELGLLCKTHQAVWAILELLIHHF